MVLSYGYIDKNILNRFWHIKGKIKKLYVNSIVKTTLLIKLIWKSLSKFKLSEYLRLVSDQLIYELYLEKVK